MSVQKNYIHIAKLIQYWMLNIDLDMISFLGLIVEFFACNNVLGINITKIKIISDKKCCQTRKIINCFRWTFGLPGKD